MNGRELARAYFAECGLPLLEREFPSLVDRCAAGLISIGLPSGCGSEVMGWDDEASRDHNWGPRFVLVLDESDMQSHGEALKAVLEHGLPAAFRGYEAVCTTLPDERCHVRTPTGVIAGNLGRETVPPDDAAWLELDECRLFELTCGEVFHEPAPLLTPALRPFAYYPENVWRKRLAFTWYALMQAGQAIRQARRGLGPTVHLYVGWAVYCAIRMAFLLRRRYAPCTKWAWHACRELPGLPGGFLELLELLTEKTDCDFVEDDLNRLVGMLGEEVNAAGIIKPIRIDLDAEHAFGAFYHYSGAFCYAIDETLPPALRGYPHDGPDDLKPFWERSAPSGRAVVRPE